MAELEMVDVLERLSLRHFIPKSWEENITLGIVCKLLSYEFMFLEIANSSEIMSLHVYSTAQKMKFSIKDFFSKCDQICNLLRIWSHLLNKSLTENFIFCSVQENICNYLCDRKNYIHQTSKWVQFEQDRFYKW